MCYRNSLALAQDLGDAYGSARIYNNLGVIAEKREQYKEAIAQYRQCLEIVRALGDGHREVTTLINLCTLYEKLQQSEEAEPLFSRAWGIAQDREYLDHLTSLCMLQGDIAFQHLECIIQAGDWYAQACRYAARLGPPTLHRVVQHIQLHIDRLQQRDQYDPLTTFCTRLLEVWSEEPLSSKEPEFVRTLQDLADQGTVREKAPHGSNA
jgi:tetratricopeptide (TPR) repeat protein